MFLLGLFMNEQFLEEERDRLLHVPEIDSAIGADAIDALIDGFCMSADLDNEAGAKDFPAWLSSAEADAATEAGFPLIWANSNADCSLPPLQQKGAEFIAEQASIAQFLDRDTRPDFCVHGDDPGAADLYR